MPAPLLDLLAYTRTSTTLPTHNSPFCQQICIYTPITTNHDSHMSELPQTTLLVSHANGLSKESLLPALQLLLSTITSTRPHIILWDLRNSGDSAVLNRRLHPTFTQINTIDDWNTFVLDLQCLMTWFKRDNIVRTWIGVGHSISATVMLRYQSDYGAFHRLIVCEPMLYPSHFGFTGEVMAQQTRKRRAVFPSRDDITAALRNKSLFASWTKDAWECYLWFSFYETSKGVELKCSPTDEALNFANGPLVDTWERLYKIDIPVLVISGRNSDVQGPERLSELALQMKHGEHTVVDGGHMWPMEKPESLAQILQSILNDDRRSIVFRAQL